MPDTVKRETRGCDAENETVAFPWAPDLRRCPKSVLTPDVLQRIQWWDDWRTFHVFPFGGATIDDEPLEVYEVIKLCETVSTQCQSEINSGG